MKTITQTAKSLEEAYMTPSIGDSKITNESFIAWFRRRSRGSMPKDDIDMVEWLLLYAISLEREIRSLRPKAEHC